MSQSEFLLRYPPLSNSTEIIKDFGLDPYLDLNRYQALISRFGHLGSEIFDFEREKNLLFRREFIEDIPYSFGNIGFMLKGKLYTQNYDNPLFLIEKMIDENERHGLTLSGFKNFQEEISRALPEEVVVWYSPASIPNDNTDYDSGRLYFSFNTNDGYNISFDIKVLEEVFPITAFLNFLNQEGLEQTSPHSFLEKPFRTGLSITNFLEIIEKSKFSQLVVYIQHRLPEDPREKICYRLSDIAIGLREELGKMSWQIEKLNDFSQKIRKPLDPIGDKTISYLPNENKLNQIVFDYWYQLKEAAEKTGGTLYLYGCSARGVKNFNISFFSIFSIYDSFNRSPVFSSQEYDFDREGICVVCHQGPKDLGPCNICKECDKKLKEQNNNLAN